MDHDARRRDVAEAVWRVLARTGFAGLSLRAVAAEMGASTGLLTHYFPDKRALVRHALEVVHQRRTPGCAVTAPDGLAGLRARLRSVLVADDEVRVLSRAWVSFWDVALADAELGVAEAQRYERWRERLRPLVETAFPARDRELTVDVLTAFTHGLVVQALFDPEPVPGRPPARRAGRAAGLPLPRRPGRPPAGRRPRRRWRPWRGRC